MRLGHFEALRPLCPACRARGQDRPLTLVAEAGTDSDITAGVLVCRDGCEQAFPIIDGIPILMPDLAGWLASNLHLVQQSDIAGAAAEAVVGALAGPDSAFNIVRQQQSTYGHSHYGDLADGSACLDVPGGAVSLLHAGLGPGPLPPGPVLDIGCAVGGGVFGLCAMTDGPVLGIDVNWPLLKIARSACDTGRVTFPFRQTGVHYDRRSGVLPGENHHKADVWVADALALPFAAGTFGQVVSLNVLDCISDPVRMVAELARSLASGGGYLVSTPFDWASHATPVHLWIADTDGVVKVLEQSGLKLLQIQEAEWKLRLHALSVMTYQVKIFTGAQA
ncbi:MAG: hypothetical protein B7Y84_09430 [Azorhizobium sp. 32-67-21]|nr:MAG: hypothetical protein B7Y84_09430 [Azorhizobium sp. 32-67-21]